MERTAFILYLTVLVISPLLFGAAHTYAYTLAFCLIFIAAVLLIINNIRKDYRTGKYYFRYLLTDANPLIYLMLIYLFFQIVPLPSSLVGLLSPETLSISQQTNPTPTIQHPTFLPLSPYVYPVRQSAIRWLAYGLFFIGFAQTLNSRRRIETAIAVILATAAFDSLYGMYQTYVGPGKIWWLSRYTGRVLGTYTNANHFAGYMEIALVLAITYACAFSRANPPRNSSFKPDIKTRLTAFLAREQVLSKRVLIVFSGLIIGLGLMLSGSRGGIIAVSISFLLMGILFSLRKTRRKQGVFVLGIFVLVFAYSLNVGMDETLERFNYFDSSYEIRARAALKTMDIFGDYQLTGTGLGSFQYAYPKYQSNLDAKMYYAFAHNDWAQFLAEAGIIGAGLLLLGGLYFLVRWFMRWQQRHDPFAIAIGTAVPAVFVTMAVHSWSDFNLHMPANFLTMLAIIAIGFAALHIKKRRAGEKSIYEFRQLYLKYIGSSSLIVLLLLILWAGTWTLRHFIAETHCNTVYNLSLNHDQDPGLSEIRQAIFWDNGNAGYWYKMAENLMKKRNEVSLSINTGDEEKKERTESIISALEQAIRLDPFTARYYQRLGWEYTYMWQEPDYKDKWLPGADQAMERADYFGGEKTPWLHQDLGNYWLMRSKMQNPSDPEWENILSTAGQYYRKALSLETGGSHNKMLKDIHAYAWNFYPDEGIIDRLGLE